VLAETAAHHARVNILIIVGVAMAVGFLLMLLIGRGQPLSPATLESGAREPSTDLAWVRSFGVEGFQRMLLKLFAEMGFDPERSERGEETVDFYAVDPTPIRGGRICVRGFFASPGVPVNGDEVRAILDTARGDGAGKVVLVTLGRFSDDARDAAKENPIDLVDGDELAALVKKHLPQSYATRAL